jgi:hypothetical protein
MTTQYNLMGTGVPAQTAEAHLGMISRNLTATGIGQSTALPLPSDFCIFSTVPVGTGCILPLDAQRLNPPDRFTIVNEGANTLLIYPGPGGQINGGTVNAPLGCATASTVTFYYLGPVNQWSCETGGISSSSGITTVQHDGAVVSSIRPAFNLIEGTNVTMTAVDNAGANRVDITVNATSGGAGGITTVEHGGSVVSSTRGAINLIDGANVTFTVADNAGSNRTDVTPAVSGVLTSVTAGTGISVTGSAPSQTVANSGVISVTAGTNVTLGGTAANPVINASGSAGPAGPPGASGISPCPANPTFIFFPPGMNGPAADTNGGFVYDSITTAQVDTWNDGSNTPSLALALNLNGTTGAVSYDSTNKMLVLPDLAYYASTTTITLHPSRYTIGFFANQRDSSAGAGTKSGMINWGNHTLHTDWGAGTSLDIASDSFTLNGNIPANAQNVNIAFLLDVNGANATIYYSLSPYTVWTSVTNTNSWSDSINNGPIFIGNADDGTNTYRHNTRAIGTYGYWPRGLTGTIAGGSASFTASISTTTLTVTAISAGLIQVGMTIAATGVTGGTTITAFQSGTLGGVGLYTVSASQTVSSEAMTGSGTPTGEYAGLLTMLATGTPQLPFVAALQGPIESNQTLFNSVKAWKRNSSPVVNINDLPDGEGITVSQALQTAVDVTTPLRNAMAKYGQIELPNNNARALASFGAANYLQISSTLTLPGFGTLQGRNSYINAGDFGNNVWGVNPLTTILPIVTAPQSTSDGNAQQGGKASLKGFFVNGNNGTYANNANILGIQLSNSARITADELGVINCYWGLWLEDLQYSDVREMWTIGCNIGIVVSGVSGGVDFTNRGNWVCWSGVEGGGSYPTGTGYCFYGQQYGTGAGLQQPMVFKNLWAKFFNTAFFTATTTSSGTIPAGGGVNITIDGFTSENTWGGYGGENETKTIQLKQVNTGAYQGNYNSGTTYTAGQTVSAIVNDPYNQVSDIWVAMKSVPTNTPPGYASAYWAPAITRNVPVTKSVPSCLGYLDSGTSIILKAFNPYDGYLGIMFDLQASSYITVPDGFAPPGNAQCFISRAYASNCGIIFAGALNCGVWSNYIYENVISRPREIYGSSVNHMLSCFEGATYAGDWLPPISGQAINVTVGSSPTTVTAVGIPLYVTITGGTLTYASCTLNGATLPTNFNNAGPTYVPAGQVLSVAWSVAPTITYAYPIWTLYSPIGSAGNNLPNRFLPSMTAVGPHTTASTAVDSINPETPPWLPASIGGTFTVGQIVFANGATPTGDYVYTAFLAGGSSQTTFTDGNDNNYAFIRLKLVSAQASAQVKLYGWSSPTVSQTASNTNGHTQWNIGCGDMHDNYDVVSVSTPSSGGSVLSPYIGAGGFVTWYTVTGGSGVQVASNNSQDGGAGADLFQFQHGVLSHAGTYVSVTTPVKLILGTANNEDPCSGFNIQYSSAPTITRQGARPQSITLWQNTWQTAMIIWSGNTDIRLGLGLAQTNATGSSIQILYKEVGYGRGNISQGVKQARWI